MPEFKEVLTPIDDMYSHCQNYRGNSVGRIIHYVTVVCGLHTGERVQVGDGSIIDGGVLIGRYNWDKGYPDIKYEDPERNSRQRELLKTVEDQIKDLLLKKLILEEELKTSGKILEDMFEKFKGECHHRDLIWGDNPAPFEVCAVDGEGPCDTESCPVVHKGVKNMPQEGE